MSEDTMRAALLKIQAECLSGTGLIGSTTDSVRRIDKIVDIAEEALKWERKEAPAADVPTAINRSAASEWQRRAGLWEQRAAALWQMLDDIDTLSDSMRPHRNEFYTRVMGIVRKRGDVLQSDGFTLSLPLGGSEGRLKVRIAELEAEVRRGRELIDRDRTGLAAALNKVIDLVDNGGTIEQVREICRDALWSSGAKANSSFHDGPPVPTPPKDEPKPVPMILYCPMCTERHIDEGEFETKVHATHSCQSCGHTWRPAVVPTVGVAYLPGFRNESPLALSDEELGRRLWAFAVDLDGPPDAEHAEALGRRARQLVPKQHGA